MNIDLTSELRHNNWLETQLNKFEALVVLAKEILIEINCDL